MNARVQDILKSLDPQRQCPPAGLALLLMRRYVQLVRHIDAMDAASEEELEHIMTNGGDIVQLDYDALLAWLLAAVAAHLGTSRCSICGEPLTVGYDEDGDVCAACYF